MRSQRPPRVFGGAGDREEDGTSREDGQKKKRKRDAKFEDKHPTD
jgi:hypothetical protein